MKQFLYHNELKPGMIVSIYTDYQQETEDSYEGEAILISKQTDGHSFTLYNEKLQTLYEDRPLTKTGKHMSLTKEQVKSNKIFTQIDTFFEEDVTKQVKTIRDTIKRMLSRDYKSLPALYHTVRRLKYEYLNDITRIGDFFAKFTTDQIVRYFQQKYIRYWSPTIFREEKWLVEFISDQYCIKNRWCLYGDMFRTYRKLRTIACLSPSEDLQNCDVRRHTTDLKPVSNSDKLRLKHMKLKGEVDEQYLSTQLDLSAEDTDDDEEHEEVNDMFYALDNDDELDAQLLEEVHIIDVRTRDTDIEGDLRDITDNTFDGFTIINTSVSDRDLGQDFNYEDEDL